MTLNHFLDFLIVFSGFTIAVSFCYGIFFRDSISEERVLWSKRITAYGFFLLGFGLLTLSYHSQLFMHVNNREGLQRLAEFACDLFLPLIACVVCFKFGMKMLGSVQAASLVKEASLIKE